MLRKKIISEKLEITHYQDNLWPITDNVFLEPKLADKIYQTIANYALEKKANKIVCIADYGLPLAGPVANLLGLPLAIAGHANKMPGRKYTSPCFEENYHHERKQLEILCEHVKASDRILIIDDKIRSGAQIRGIIEALNPTEHHIVGVFSLFKIDSLFNEKSSLHYKELVENYKINIYSYYNILPDGKIFIDKRYEKSERITPNEIETKNINIDNLVSQIKLYHDFPTKGVDWTDFSAFQLNPSLNRFVVDTITKQFTKLGINKIVCFDVRGQDFAAAIAHKMNLPLAIIRKTSRLANPVYIATRINMEYANNIEIGISPKSISSKDIIGIFDDIHATGGTILGGINICKALSAKVVGCSTLIHLLDISHKHPHSKLKEIIKEKVDIHSIIKITKEQL